MQDYTIRQVEETQLPPDNYGNVFWKVTFNGVADPVLWKTKSSPIENSVVFGHMEPSQSGKSTLFKKDKKPDDYIPGQATSQPTQQATMSHNDGEVIKALRAIYKQNEEILKALADQDARKMPAETNVEEAHAQEMSQRDWESLGKNQPVSLDDIPF